VILVKGNQNVAVSNRREGEPQVKVAKKRKFGSIRVHYSTARCPNICEIM
jgi:hypothetical protein